MTSFLEDHHHHLLVQFLMTVMKSHSRAVMCGCVCVAQEMQWSLSSVMLGRPSPTSAAPAAPTPPVPGSENGVGGTQLGDDANERLKQYADELERILTDAHKQAATFLKKQKGG